MFPKNQGPCVIHNCDQKTNRFRVFTLLAYQKSREKCTFPSYSYLKVGQQLCHNHYMRIVEPYRNKENTRKSTYFISAS
ncbi:hypothetical protein Glove_54g36 [Diversispora epigaea]|uniref:Uncharacterized protein n=1 Tax=Diversispora epigaea TaxID=1348612 RepID=A0A397JCQ1_9GLOM|nr:hypothetical protein Glove_54g36 [Diversispora epigaea]